jgi:hypothetical protein
MFKLSVNLHNQIIYNPSINNKFDRTLKITNLTYEIRDFECPIGLIVYVRIGTLIYVKNCEYKTK